MKTSFATGRALLLILLAAPACGFVHSSVHGDGTSYHESNGVFYKDDVALRHERWVKVEQPLPADANLELRTVTGPITITGGASPDTCDLEVRVLSEVEGDGEAGIADGKLTVTSATGKAVAINGVRGSVPAGHMLFLESSTGDLSLAKLESGTPVHFDTSTGDVSVSACTLPSLSVETSTGDIDVRELQTPSLEIDTSTGDARLKGCKAEALDFESSTGDLELDNCQFKRSAIESSTGDAVLRNGSSLGAVTHDLGVGELKTIQN